MISTNSAPAINTSYQDTHKIKFRGAARGKESIIFTDIYQEDINIAIWQRELPTHIKNSISVFVAKNPAFQSSMTITPQSAYTSINDSFGNHNLPELSKNITELVEMYSCLFELERIGLRLTTLDHAMCPKFHVDKVPCRLITTYQGVATEWLPHQAVNREKLNIKNDDLQTNLIKREHEIQQLNCGDVALLKGELWEGNEGAGLVHRSPSISTGENRLLLTLDFID